MSVKQFTADQLREELERREAKHISEVSELKAEIRELINTAKIKVRIETVVNAEYTQEYLPKFVITILNNIDPKKKLSYWYIKAMSLVNYMLVSGIGVLINMYILYALINYLPLWLANLFAIFIAFGWNWTLSVGPLGYITGLSPRRIKVKST